ncbi:deoxyribonuclease IV [Microlunatus sp. Gsoil 973]|jgi:deoxyribonuclease-4|uniref:deoxyribonuclease IV n=1 Tax=Microlunatus sp. Gsoil 973 TaxID=2672569 RepID=UPI0012B4CDD2|nr:deoxyribonuclease IV [Microlunatus sp. Gsoil 973]QGN34219.1 deoxyribonuclease IV [Microlunatus sp. Gsoil 973]
MSELLIGGHGEQEDPIAQARARDAGLAQFFLGDPQDWKGPKIAYAGGAEALKDAAGEAGITLYVHAPYVINVATSNNRIRIPSRKILQQQLDAAHEVGAAGLIVHGGHVLAKDDPGLGFENWHKCIERAEIKVPLLIENTAGGDRAMARHLSSIEKLWQAVQAADGSENVGFCLDTCHFHAGGEELVGLVDKVKAITGRIDLVHCNDSRDAFGSGADRHTNLGSGEADPEGLVAVVKAAGAPVVVETPGGIDGQAADIAWLRERC